MYIVEKQLGNDVGDVVLEAYHDDGSDYSCHTTYEFNARQDAIARYAYKLQQLVITLAKGDILTNEQQGMMIKLRHK